MCSRDETDIPCAASQYAQLTGWNERADVLLLQFIEQGQIGEYLRREKVGQGRDDRACAYVEEIEKC